MTMKEKEAIKEGDNVQVPRIEGTASNLVTYGKVLYLQPPIAMVQLRYGTKLMKQAFRIEQLTKITIMSEKQAREQNEQESENAR